MNSRAPGDKSGRRLDGDRVESWRRGNRDAQNAGDCIGPLPGQKPWLITSCEHASLA